MTAGGYNVPGPTQAAAPRERETRLSRTRVAGPVPDVHARPPTAGRVTLRRVGVSGIQKPVAVQRPERVVTLTTTFRVSVDLPATRKGSDLSRNAELLAEIVDNTATRPVQSLESACVAIARELLHRHSYASEAEVEASAAYFLPRGISERHVSLEDYTLVAGARAWRENGDQYRISKSVGAEAVGMTACPCAMETCREALAEEYPLLKDPSLADLPMITHNQRNRTRLLLDMPPEVEVEADRLLDVIEAAQSSPTYAILKRGDEAKLVLNAHRHPKFVEDVLRDLLSRVGAGFPSLPESVVVHADTLSEESIHKYNVSASHTLSLGELRRTIAA
jgi:GTP cyclohydrolase IV